MRVEFDQEQTFDVEFHAEQDQVTVEQSQDMPVSFDQARPMDVDFVQDAFDVDFKMGSVVPYAGQYEITPSEESQVLHTSNKMMEQDVIVDPIPDEYVKTDDATLENGGQMLDGVSAFSHGEKIMGTMPSKGSEIYIPSASDQIIHAGQYLAEDQVISGDQNLVPENIKDGVSVFNVVGTLFTGLKPVIMRRDAELIKTFSYDKMAVEDEGITIPAYTTTATVIKASEALDETVTLDYENYNYYVVEKMLTIPEYSVTSKAKGRQEWGMCSALYEIAEIPGNVFHALLDPSKSQASRSISVTASGTFPRLIYWSSSSAVSAYASSAYGAYQTVTAPTIASGILTLKSPAFGIRGHASYLSSTYFNAITDIRYQWIIEVWKAPKGDMNIDGWSSFQDVMHIVDCLNTPNHKLT